ncbi:MAG: hypothetical protein C4306_10395 [Thermoleophilia bacterium]
MTDDPWGGVEAACLPGRMVSGRVSIIVPTRNAARTIQACLASMRAQTYGDVEIVVVDNGSTDGTLDVAGELAQRVLSAGPERSAQRNAGAAAATGEFLVFIDADMRLSPRVAEEVVAVFRSEASLEALVIPECSVGKGLWARCRALEKEVYLGDAAVEAARAFRREAFEAAGGYDEEIDGGTGTCRSASSVQAERLGGWAPKLPTTKVASPSRRISPRSCTTAERSVGTCANIPAAQRGSSCGRRSSAGPACSFGTRFMRWDWSY